DSSGLDRRKNWRSHYLPKEFGIKCSLMGDWQELSGIVGVRKKDRENREAFWGELFSTNDFTKKEHLCAIAYIKRRFLSIFKDFKIELGLESRQFTAHGWKLPQSVPSVAYIAAAPWFSNIIKQGISAYNEAQGSKQIMDDPLFYDFISKAKKLGGTPEYNSTIKCLRLFDANIRSLDGNVFHESALKNANIFPKRDENGSISLCPLAVEVGSALSELVKLTDSNGKIIGKATPFYAVLMMDGDHLGQQMSDEKKQSDITQGLDKFINQELDEDLIAIIRKDLSIDICSPLKGVSDIVEYYNGFLIYAGGDDVLAIITLEDALNCAKAIRIHYQNCFQKINKERKGNEPKIDTTISASIIYVHINMPLKKILHESHQLLDDIAKDKAGRDALALRVYKGSGLAVQWAKKWDEALHKNDYVLQQSVKHFQNDNGADEQFSSQFFYKIRQRFDLLYGKDKKQQGENPLDKEQAIKLMAMEYMQSVDNKALTMKEAEDIIRPLMEQSQNAAEDNQITADAALLIRFLAQKGIEGGHE
ncbi:MAG: type III-B CRISPR-associated protein Cas10/Cmr2, partial [Ostreibacterium sp.]